MSTSFLARLFAFPLARRQRTLMADRSPMNEADFSLAISDAGGDAPAAPLIRSKLMRIVVEPGFTPYPEDSLYRVFGLADEDLDEDLILAVLIELGLEPPDQASVLSFGAIDTPLRIAQFVTFTRSFAR